MDNLVPTERIESKILLIRGEKVMLDRDLAELYEVPTKRLNEQVKRNIKRFPDDFIFQLTKEEKDEVVANCDHLKSLKYSPQLPYAFTEQGVAMLSSVLNSERAILVNIQIMRAFTKLRKILASHEDLRRKLEDMEMKYDTQFKVVFDAIKSLMTPPTKEQKKIGFV
ncbi:MAG: ORF6N domain-containing protein [bacterium]|nr:ORF6N domain-containing protein [bacterium]